MSERSSFPRVFWVANLVELLERFSYYGIYFGFGIYMKSLGLEEQLGTVQTMFLFLSYTVPVISGTFADRFGFKKVLIVAYLAYLPSILLLIATKSFSGIALAMLSIGLAAGIFKPLIAGTVRAVTDRSNKTLGFGIFYAMVNVGGSLGPIVAGKLRAISWDYAFLAAAISIGFMLLITIFFYEEQPREESTQSLGDKFRDIGVALSDKKFALFLFLLGAFFWVPFWAFFNLCALYVDSDIDSAALYVSLEGVFGATVLSLFSAVGDDGKRRILGETVSHTGWIIMFLQVFVSRWTERFRALPTFMVGLAIATVGFGVLGYARVGAATLVFLGIFLFAVGEMIASPRIQEYITWLAPKEKAGLYMGTNFLAVGIGACSGLIYTPMHAYFTTQGNPEYVWYVVAAHVVVGILIFGAFSKFAGEFQERDS
jgi:POT family proton-dependent oligopeptide transporter